MAMVRYTSGFDYLLIIVRYACFGLWLAAVVSFLEATGLSETPFPEQALLKIIALLLSLAFFFGSAAFLHHFTTAKLLSIFSAWLYIRFTLKTPISFFEAAQVRALFVLNTSGKWYPCTEVLSLPQGQRVAYIMNFHAQLENA